MKYFSAPTKERDMGRRAPPRELRKIVAKGVHTALPNPLENFVQTLAAFSPNSNISKVHD
jgi:hypothetical protein